MPESDSFELHVWGPLGSLPSFSPECLATIWYLSMAISDQSIVHIYPSSNTQISPSGVLPALRHNGAVYSGYTSILRYLKSLGYDLDSPALTSSESNTKLPATLAYLDTNLAAISQYLTFVQNKNYEDVTRPLLSKLIPFPMQYAVPLKERSIAIAQCQSLGLQRQETSSVGGPGSSEDPTTKYPALSRLHAQLEEQKKQKELSLKEVKESMRMMVFAHEVFDNIIALGGEEQPDPKHDGKTVWTLFSNMSSADLLLLAHLIIQTNEAFPYAPVRALITSEYPQLVRYIEGNIGHLNELKFNIEETRKGDSPTLFNTAYGWLYSWFA